MGRKIPQLANVETGFRKALDEIAFEIEKIGILRVEDLLSNILEACSGLDLEPEQVADRFYGLVKELLMRNNGFYLNKIKMAQMTFRFSQTEILFEELNIIDKTYIFPDFDRDLTSNQGNYNTKTIIETVAQPFFNMHLGATALDAKPGSLDEKYALQYVKDFTQSRIEFLNGVCNYYARRILELNSNPNQDFYHRNDVNKATQFIEKIQAVVVAAIHGCKKYINHHPEAEDVARRFEILYGWTKAMIRYGRELSIYNQRSLISRFFSKPKLPDTENIKRLFENTRQNHSKALSQ